MSRTDVANQLDQRPGGVPWMRRLAAAIDRRLTGRAVTGDEPLDTQIQVVSPENIAFNYRVAGPFRRLMAFLIDLVLCISFFIALMLLLGLVVALVNLVLRSAGLGRIGTGFEVVSQTIYAVICFLVWWFYAAIFETWMNGQTLAKRMLGLRVLSVDGNPIGGWQAALRTIVRAAEVLPIVTIQVFDPWIQPAFAEMPGTNGQTPPFPLFPTFLVALLTMAMTPRFQRIGDLVSGTMVVRETRNWMHGLARLEDPRAPQLAEYIPAGFVFSQSLTRALATYVDRRRYFSPERRKEIARPLVEPLLEQFGLPPDTGYDLMLCALYHRAFVADQGSQELPELRLNAEARRFEPVVPEFVYLGETQGSTAAGSEGRAASSSAGRPS